MSNFTLFREKMEASGVSEAAILTFQRNYEALCNDATGVIDESSIEPISNLTDFEHIADEKSGFSKEQLAQTVVIKLNGGLGTSMGLQKAKSLLTVRDGKSFLDIIVEQVLHLREYSDAEIKFLLMNSFSTSEDTLKHLEEYVKSGLEEPKETELLQNQVPKINADTLHPVEHKENPEMEWCPPGHGDIYVALNASGVLDELLEQGVKYAFISNADNLGATMDSNILNYFVTSEKPFLMEVTRRTAADKKGGHLAIRKEDGQMLLREVAQTSEEDLDEFQNIEKHQYFNTNSLWIRLDSLKETMESHKGIMPLPMIKNKKTVDPRDKSSQPVFQLEVAMGAAIECFKGADAICVPRSRFAPVKTTSDLMALCSDAYTLTEDSRVVLSAERNGVPPIVSLSQDYKLVDSLEGMGCPSLKNTKKLTINGLVRFTEGVVIKGEVEISNSSVETKWVPSGLYQDETVEL